jgi:hypothetical protein
VEVALLYFISATVVASFLVVFVLTLLEVN